MEINPKLLNKERVLIVINFILLLIFIPGFSYQTKLWLAQLNNTEPLASILKVVLSLAISALPMLGISFLTTFSNKRNILSFGALLLAVSGLVTLPLGVFSIIISSSIRYFIKTSSPISFKKWLLLIIFVLIVIGLSVAGSMIKNNSVNSRFEKAAIFIRSNIQNEAVKAELTNEDIVFIFKQTAKLTRTMDKPTSESENAQWILDLANKINSSSTSRQFSNKEIFEVIYIIGKFPSQLKDILNGGD